MHAGSLKRCIVRSPGLTARDGFLKKVIDDVAKRAGYQCSNPGCRRGTIGPSESNSDKHIHIGIAAHITATSPGGPRYSSHLTPEARKAITNAIYLCTTCADLIDKNQDVDFPIDRLLRWKEIHEGEIAEGLKNPRVYREEKKLKKNGLAVLEKWSQQLNEDIYKNRFEIVELFCRYIIPFIQKHPDFQPLVVDWRKSYEVQLLENNALQKKVLEETAQTFREIVNAIRDISEPLKLKIADIEEILNGRPGREGYTSWPQYRKAYWAVKELLEMLFREGKTDLCACYANFDTTQRYVENDGKYQVVKKTHIAEFTFSSTIEEADQAEKEFSNLQLQDVVKIWSYFEVALYFWCMTDQDIKKNLDYLYKVHPLRAASQKAAWFEINLVKRQREGRCTPIIFTTELFKEGLRTVINEILLACVCGSL